MKYKRFIGILLIIGILLTGTFISCGSASPGSAGSGGGEEFEVIRQAADAYMSSGKPLTITAQELYDSVMEGIGLSDYEILWYDPLVYTNAPFILDVRGSDPEMPDPYWTGHIPGAINVPWRETSEWKNIKNLPKAGLREVAVVSGTGHIGAEITGILNILGYDAINLMWGMTAWTSDIEVAPGRYGKSRDTVFNWGGSYRAICPISEPIETYSFPTVENTDSQDEYTIILAAADAYLKDGGKRFSMSSPELYQALYYQSSGDARDLLQSLYFTDTATGNPYTVPFFLDVRDDETYYNGHLCGTLHFYYEDVFKKENLMKLPPDRQILVYSDTGHESGTVTALLNMLGYDAVNLRWGISSWSLSLPGKDVAPDRFDQDRDCMDYPMVQGFQAFELCPG
jgi:rhodanese-related sulfurtransferase